MIPLATQLRPNTLNEFIGQTNLVGEGGPVRKMLELGQIHSMIFWGPPASGKTTLARIIASKGGADFVELSAVMEGKSRLKQIISQAEEGVRYGRQTILFIDEIHRWSKSQQDALLPYVESGVITLIGATTENPSFTIINALLSRSRVFVFETLTVDEIVVALRSGIDFMFSNDNLTVSIAEVELKYLAELANGDVRFALNTLQILALQQTGKVVTKEVIEASANKFLRHDKNGEEHYNLISAVHKALRSSNPSGGIYWVTRLLEAGEDPLYIARRLLRFASEDIGNATPTALLLANATYDTCAKLGMPECALALIQLTEYLARSPKSNAVYTAYNSAQKDVRKYGNLPIPLHLRNAPTELLKELDYGKNYEYDHDLANGQSSQQIMPDELVDRDYFA